MAISTNNCFLIHSFNFKYLVCKINVTVMHKRNTKMYLALKIFSNLEEWNQIFFDMFLIQMNRFIYVMLIAFWYQIIIYHCIWQVLKISLSQPFSFVVGSGYADNKTRSRFTDFKMSILQLELIAFRYQIFGRSICSSTFNQNFFSVQWISSIYVTIWSQLWIERKCKFTP